MFLARIANFVRVEVEVPLLELAVLVLHVAHRLLRGVACRVIVIVRGTLLHELVNSCIAHGRRPGVRRTTVLQPVGTHGANVLGTLTAAAAHDDVHPLVSGVNGRARAAVIFLDGVANFGSGGGGGGEGRVATIAGASKRSVRAFEREVHRQELAPSSR